MPNALRRFSSHVEAFWKDRYRCKAEVPKYTLPSYWFEKVPMLLWESCLAVGPRLEDFSCDLPVCRAIGWCEWRKQDCQQLRRGGVSDRRSYIVGRRWQRGCGFLWRYAPFYARHRDSGSIHIGFVHGAYTCAMQVKEVENEDGCCIWFVSEAAASLYQTQAGQILHLRTPVWAVWALTPAVSAVFGNNSGLHAYLLEQPRRSMNMSHAWPSWLATTIPKTM